MVKVAACSASRLSWWGRRWCLEQKGKSGVGAVKSSRKKRSRDEVLPAG